MVMDMDSLIFSFLTTWLDRSHTVMDWSICWLKKSLIGGWVVCYLQAQVFSILLGLAWTWVRPGLSLTICFYETWCLLKYVDWSWNRMIRTVSQYLLNKRIIQCVAQSCLMIASWCQTPGPLRARPRPFSVLSTIKSWPVIDLLSEGQKLLIAAQWDLRLRWEAHYAIISSGVCYLNYGIIVGPDSDFEGLHCPVLYPHF